jgi:hypothetical protein
LFTPLQGFVVYKAAMRRRVGRVRLSAEVASCGVLKPTMFRQTLTDAFDWPSVFLSV